MGCRNPQSDALSFSAAGARVHQATGGLEDRTPALRAYDAKLTKAIRQRWYALLDEGRFQPVSEGAVVVSFTLLSTGKVRDLRTVESNVSQKLERTCLQAIEDPAPYLPWPEEMRRFLNRSTREITFTFRYGE